MNYKKISIVAIIALFILVQLFRIDKTNPEVNPEKDYLTMSRAPENVSAILKTSCYDCHSNETVYPWYSNIAPMSWMLKSHIDEARDHMNFSLWAELSEASKIGAQENCFYEIEDNKMPLKSYTLIHRDAKLTDESRETLMNWFNSQTGQ